MGRISSIDEGIHKLWDNKILFDYTLKAEGKEFRAHKMLLASISDYFYALFTAEMVESKKDCLDLKGIPAAGMGPLLQFIYTGELPLTADNVGHVVHSSTHLQVHDATKVCCKFLIDNINHSNFMDIQNIANMYSLTDVEEIAKNFASKNFLAISQVDSFKAISSQELASHLGKDIVKCESEYELFEAVVRWFSFEPAIRVKVLAEVLPSIRFCLMSLEELEKVEDCAFMKSDNIGRELLKDARTFHGLSDLKQIAWQTPQSAVRNQEQIYILDWVWMANGKLHTLLNDQWETVKLDMHQEGMDIWNGGSAGVLQNILYVCGGGGGEQRRHINLQCY